MLPAEAALLVVEAFEDGQDGFPVVAGAVYFLVAIVVVGHPCVAEDAVVFAPGERFVAFPVAGPDQPLFVVGAC